MAVILKWLSGTEAILNRTLQQYDRNARASIVPSLDIGVPNNVLKIAGGFMSGCYIKWECTIPFIPVDAMINVCMSGVFKTNGLLPITSIDRFATIVRSLKSRKKAYAWNFDQSNHFISLTTDGYDHYLVFHVSASEDDQSLADSLYPMRNNWYWNHIRHYQTSDRYLRYLIDDFALAFVEKYRGTPKLNLEYLEYFANLFMGDIGCIERRFIHPHYGMCGSHVVNAGCFVVENDEVVPIFSTPGNDIFLYKVGRDDFEIDHKKIIPHGWGKSYPGLKSIFLSSDFESLLIDDREYSVRDNIQLDAKYRSYSTRPDSKDYYFHQVRRFLTGSVVKRLKQLYSYSSTGFADFSRGQDS